MWTGIRLSEPDGYHEDVIRTTLCAVNHITRRRFDSVCWPLACEA
jgi:hypothetical protein